MHSSPASVPAASISICSCGMWYAGGDKNGSRSVTSNFAALPPPGPLRNGDEFFTSTTRRSRRHSPAESNHAEVSMVMIPSGDAPMGGRGPTRISSGSASSSTTHRPTSSATASGWRSISVATVPCSCALPHAMRTPPSPRCAAARECGSRRASQGAFGTSSAKRPRVSSEPAPSRRRLFFFFFLFLAPRRPEADSPRTALFSPFAPNAPSAPSATGSNGPSAFCASLYLRTAASLAASSAALSVFASNASGVCRRR
mmetsp:Transcript_12261/g.52677  ORF Transcript_12261/g.52677 Transcript_12261/m.52677 type:complete len:257 (-) Transcript_12261:433-1203(-)